VLYGTFRPIYVHRLEAALDGRSVGWRFFKAVDALRLPLRLRRGLRISK
jgi:hypothetical protein